MVKLSPEGIEMTDYHNDQVQDNVFQAVILRLYQKFTLLNEKLGTIFKVNGLPSLKAALARSFDAVRNVYTALLLHAVVYGLGALKKTIHSVLCIT
jgi:hypothetical protein